MKIAKEYIEASIKLRKEWIENTNSLTAIQNDLEQFNTSLQKILQKLANLKDQEDVSKKDLHQVINELEESETRMAKSIEPLTLKSNSLKEEAKILMSNIQARYPELTEEEIQIEIANQLNIQL
jgi:chromosome segregation ATPase